MDIEDLKSNLHALKKLYGLLSKDEEGSPNLTCDLLDEKSRLLLKDLLDIAAENVFKGHPKSAQKISLQLGKTSMQLPARENSAMLQSCGNDLLNDIDFTQSENECGFKEPRNQTLTQPMQSVAASGFGNRHEYCRVCQRRIARHSIEELATSDTRNGAKFTAVPQQQNNQYNSFLPGDKKDILRSSHIFPEFLRSAEDNKQKGVTHLDCLSSGIGSTDSSSNRSSIGIESRLVRESTEESAQETKCLDYISEDISDVIKRIEIWILDLQRGRENLASSGSNAVSISGGAQQELSEKTDFAPQAESIGDIELKKSLLVTGSESNQSEFSATGIKGTDDRQCKGTSSLHPLPSVPKDSPTEMKLPNWIAGSPLKQLQRRKTMKSPVSSKIGRYGGLASGQNMQIEKGNIYEENKRQNEMKDWAQLESDYATASNCLLPNQVHDYDSFWAEGNKISKRGHASTNCLSHQINKADLVLEKKRAFKKCLISKDYMKNQKVQALDSELQVSEILGSKSKKGFLGEINKRQTSLNHKANQHSMLLNSNSKCVDEDQVGVLKMNEQVYPARRILQHQQESDDTSFSSNSSNWISQQTSMSNTDSEENYLPGQIQRRNYVSSSMSDNDLYSLSGENQVSPSTSENGLYSLSGESQEHYAGLSSSDNEAYHWRSSDRPHKPTSYSSVARKENSFPNSASSSQSFSTDDSDIEGYSPYNQPRIQHHGQHIYSSVGSTSKEKMSPVGVCIPTKRTNPRKRIGRWNKLKDKLSVIFHHYHHHHHHHHHHHKHPDDDEDLSNCESRKIREKLISKRASHRMIRPEAYEEPTLEKIGKAVIHGGDSKKQHNPVNALIGGLFKHIRHSKEQKPLAKHTKELRKGKYDGNKVSAKVHWLKMLQRHRRTKKLGVGIGKRD